MKFVISVLVYLVLSHENGWEEGLWNDLFCVEWDAKLNIQYLEVMSGW